VQAAGEGTYRRASDGPVLKHGPRSTLLARVCRWLVGRAFVTVSVPRSLHARRSPLCRYPKDGDLCVSGVRPGETLAEALSGSDVQIDRATRA